MPIARGITAPRLTKSRTATPEASRCDSVVRVGMIPLRCGMRMGHDGPHSRNLDNFDEHPHDSTAIIAVLQWKDEQR